MMEGVGTGKEKEHLAQLTVMCAVEKPQSKESGSWSSGREFPLLSIFTHMKSTESRQTVSGACAFQCPSLVACCKGRARRGMRGVLQAEGTACAKLAVSGAGDSRGVQGEMDRLWARTGVGWGRACR